MNNESLAILLRSNLACHLGKNITQELLNELTSQIMESMEFLLNKICLERKNINLNVKKYCTEKLNK